MIGPHLDHAQPRRSRSEPAAPRHVAGHARRALYELWWLPHQGRCGLALHRNGELFDAVSFDRAAEALARAEAWRRELQA